MSPPPPDGHPNVVTRARRGLLAVVIVAAAVRLIVLRVPQVCHQVAQGNVVLQVCEPLAIGDVRVALFILVVALLLLPEVSELQLGGLVTLRREVSKAQAQAADAHAAVEQLRMEVQLRQTQVTTISVDARQAGTGAAVAEALDGPLQPVAADEVRQLAYQAGVLGLVGLLPVPALVFVATSRNEDGRHEAVQVVPEDGAGEALVEWLNTFHRSGKVAVDHLNETILVAALAGDEAEPLGALVVEVQHGADLDALGAYLEAAAQAYAVLLTQLLGEGAGG